MKKIILPGIIVLMIVSCGPKPPVTLEPPPPPCGKEWTMTPPYAEDAYYGVGDAKMANRSFAKRVAEGRARGEIARTCSTLVSSLLQTFMEQSGIMAGGQNYEFAKTVGKNVSSITLAGSRITDTCWLEGPGGSPVDYWVLVEYRLGDLKEVTLETTQTEIQKPTWIELYTKYLAEGGLEDLEKAVAAMKLKPPDVTETPDE